MCEFNVFFDGEKVFEDVIYAKSEAGKVVLKDILGVSKKFQNCVIAEVNVISEKLILSRAL